MKNQEQIAEQLETIGREWDSVRAGYGRIGDIEDTLVQVRNQVTDLRRNAVVRAGAGAGDRPRGKLSRDAAANLGAHFILNLQRCGKFEAAFQDDTHRSALLREVRSELGIQQKWTGQTTSEFPLPYSYSGELDVLIAEYGVARNALKLFPLGPGTSKPPRYASGMDFGSIAMSAVFTEKNPSYGHATLEPHKVGGIVITPRELHEHNVVDIGQYLAKLGAAAFAKAEDTWAFQADGTATYESVSGICKIADDNSKSVSLATGKTSPSDAAVTDFRKLLGLVNTSVLSTGKFYLNATWRCYLPELNSEKNQYVYRETPDGGALLFGRPVVWTEVLQPYVFTAAAATNIAVFGDLDWWWFGRRMDGPRIDLSADVLFAYDQIATRFIEEIDFDYCALDAAAVLKTAAS